MIKFYTVNALALAIMLAGGMIYADTTFILKNGSSAGPIQVDVMQNGKSVSGGLKSIAKDGELALDIPIAKATTMELHYCKTASSCKTELPEKLVVKFPQGKTMYVKFDGKQLEKQKGSFGKTTGKYSGLSLANNVDKNEISITHAKTPKSDLGVGGKMPHAGPTGSEKTPAMPQKPAKPTAPKPAKPATSPASTTQQKTAGLSGDDLAWTWFPEALKIKKETTKPNGTFDGWNTYAAVLGVDPKAGKTEIKEAYKAGVVLYHPDKYAGLSQEKKDMLPEDEETRTQVFKIFETAYKYLK